MAHKALLAISKDDVEVSAKVNSEGGSLNLFDLTTAELGLAYYLKDVADFGVQAQVDTKDLKNGKRDIFLGVGKRFAPNLYAKAKFSWLTATAAYYASYSPSSNFTVASTLEVNHSQSKESTFKGCCEYPFNFGIQCNFNA